MSFTRPDYRDVLRWGVCGVVALTFHGAVAAVLLTPGEIEESADQMGGFVVELAEVPVTRADVPLDIAPGPDQVQSVASTESHGEKQAEKTEEPKPEDEPQALPPAPEPEAVLPVAIKEVKEEKLESQAQNAAPTTSATQAIGETQGPVAMAPVQAAPKPFNSNAVPSWKSRLQTLVERNKRYPGAAQARRETGVVMVAFEIDRSGKLLNSRIEQSSGHAALDGEALELLTRVQSFPVPPPEIPGATLKIALPIRFNLK